MDETILKELLWGMIEHLRTLHHEVREMKVISLSVRDTLSQLLPNAQVEAIYKKHYQRHFDETKAPYDAVLGLLADDGKLLGPPPTGNIH